MQQNFKNMKILFSGAQHFDEIKALPAKKTFDEHICSYLNTLSQLIRKDTEARKYPDIITFGFFCRKANIEKLKQNYYKQFRIGRGVSFHIAPSNVPINFAYSLTAGLLAGNSCIVRISTKKFEQTNILCRLMKTACEQEHSNIEKYITIIQYERDPEINNFLSSFSDIRIIWGGDQTIAHLRESKTPSRCIELTFADRYSLCVLYAEDILKVTDWEKTAQNFYNDTYLYDQNACSSPRLMYWVGKSDEIKKAKEAFWKAIHQFTTEKYTIEPVIAVDKLTLDYKAAIELKDIKLEKHTDNLFHRIHLKQLIENPYDFACPGGSFLEYDDIGLDALKNIITSKYQTLSYLGGNGHEIAEWVLENGLKGIDRIVPVGNTADFTLTWDGYDLIDTMSRQIFYS